MVEDKIIGLFGVPFDPLPSEEALIIKRMYIHMRSQVLGRGGLSNYADPYDYFLNSLSPVVYSKCYFHGEVAIPTWLRPKPQIADAGKLTLNSFSNFIKSGGCLTIARQVQDYIRDKIFPNIPGMIGVDHSSTYGILSALREYHGENIGLILFDSHSDIIPMSLRYRLIEYAKEANIPTISPDAFSQGTLPSFSSQEISEWEQLNAENFILHLLKDNILDPKNLILIGQSDYPDGAFEEIDDPRVREYSDFFKSLEDAGTCFISKSSLREHGMKPLENALQGLNAKKVHLSLDIDIGSLSPVYACRFLNTVGLSFGEIQDLFQYLYSSFSDGLKLVGFDLMEVDIHKLGARIDSSHVDKTDEVGKLFLELIGGVV